MERWYELQPEFFEDEKRILEGLGYALDTDWLEQKGIVSFTGYSKQDAERKLRVVFPSGYPSMPPEVFDESTKPILKRHQNPHNRALCLYGPAQGNWISSMTSDTAINDAEAIIAKYGTGQETSYENEVPEPVSELLPSEGGGGFLIPVNIANALLSGGVGEASGECTLRVDSRRPGFTRGVVLSVKERGNIHSAAQGYANIVGGQQAAAVFIRLDRNPEFASDDLNAKWLGYIPATIRAKLREKFWCFYVFPEERASGIGLGGVILEVTPRSTKWHRCFWLSDEQAVSRIPGLEGLGDKKIVLIGAGALGSRIAVCLASSGAKNFVLVDKDIYDPVNSVRHECTFEYFGLPKVEALHHRLASYKIGVQSVLMAVRVGNMALQDEDTLCRQISESDIVIQAAGSEHVAHWIDRLCVRLEKTCVHASVTNGAWGGRVIRVIPGKTACWVCNQYVDLTLSVEPTPSGWFFGPGCLHPTFTGTKSEVSIIADIAASMVIETTLERNRRDFTGSHVLWNARLETGEWCPSIKIFDAPVREACPVCRGVEKK